MRRLLLALVCVLGGTLGVYGLALAITSNDFAGSSFLLAGTLPVLALLLAGVRDWRLLLKTAGYAILGWWLTAFLEPATSETRNQKTWRIATDPFNGQGWILVAHGVSGLLATVGVLFASSDQLKRQR